MSATDDRDWIADMQRRMGVIQLVLDERERQTNKYGAIPRGLSDDRYNTILGEETGEVARAIIDDEPEHMLVELVQVAAVAVAWVEERLLQGVASP